jgi:hypothetical protein
MGAKFLLLKIKKNNEKPLVDDGGLFEFIACIGNSNARPQKFRQ